MQKVSFGCVSSYINKSENKHGSVVNQRRRGSGSEERLHSEGNDLLSLYVFAIRQWPIVIFILSRFFVFIL